MQALAENLPARLLIRADGFKGAAGLPDTLTLNAIQLDASGDLKSGYLIRGGASLPGEGGAVALSLDGRVDAQGADIRQLRLDAGGEQRLELVGRLDWRESLAADATLDWKDFPWLRLYPLAEPPPVTLKTFKAEVHYQDQRYLGNFSAAASGPAGDFTLASPVSGDALLGVGDLLSLEVQPALRRREAASQVEASVEATEELRPKLAETVQGDVQAALQALVERPAALNLVIPQAQVEVAQRPALPLAFGARLE